MRKPCFIFILIFTFVGNLSAQLKWQHIDSLYQPLPASVHIYFTNDQMDTGLFRAYYLIADLKDKKLEFTVDTSRDRRLTPSTFYDRNDKALVVVNCTFFSYETNRSLNVVVKDGKLVGYNQKTILNKKDSTYNYITRSAIGISRERSADITWLYTDSLKKWPYSLTFGPSPKSGIKSNPNLREVAWSLPCSFHKQKRKWKMQTAVGGGPALLQNGEINITNEKEKMFTGKAINDKHPRTAMGYTKEGKLIILVIEGRNKNAGGATLAQEAQIFKDLGCWEALNLDGGGSSCMLVNGKETIKVSDAAGQRPVPAVFIIKNHD
jgi:hypothetical protein